MSSSKTVKLSESEIDHILMVFRWAAEEGTYVGNKKHFWNRHEKIGKKLEGVWRDEKENNS